MSKEISIQEIARLAGVSKTTVSRVINNKAEVNPQTRKKVEAIIEKYDYYPNARAQMFSYQKTRNIALVFPRDEVATLSNPYYAELLQGVIEKAKETNYHIILSCLAGDDCLNLVRSKMVDGLLILTPGSDAREKLEDLMRLGLPVVSTARVLGMKRLPHVIVDEYDATYKILEYLIGLKHRHIAIINGPRTLYSTSQRCSAYKAALQEHGIELDNRLMLYGDTSVGDGMRQMHKLLDSGVDITAVFTGSDLMAIGASKAIAERGLKVPDDISLVSTDGTDTVSLLDLPPTTFRQPTRLRGQLAMGMLVDLIEGRDTETSIMIPMDIQFKNTTGEQHKK